MIPPYVWEQMLRHGAPEQRAAAKKQLRLAEAVRLKRAMVFNHAFEELERTPGERTRKTYDAQGTENSPETVSRGEGDPETDQIEVNEAHDGAGWTWDLLKGRFNRDSLDDQGMVLVSIVDWDKMDNAFWDGVKMTYGRGQIFNRFTADPTVNGHELGHGVIQFTAGLVYQGEPGALNEHIADVIGSMVEQYALHQMTTDADWLIGKELMTPTLNGRALRDMMNPGTAYVDDPLIGTDPQPAHYKDRYKGFSDNGGVHINSGIGNRAYAIAATKLGGFVWEHVGRLWFDALTDARISPTTTYSQFASLIRVISREKYTTDIQDAVKFGWANVGLDEETPAPPDNSPSDCPREIREALARLSASPDARKLIAWGRVIAARQNKEEDR